MLETLEIELGNELTAAKEAAYAAGEIIMKRYQEEYEVQEKLLDNGRIEEIVTEVDKEADNTIIRLLGEKFPEYGILTEESRDNEKRLEKDYVWIIDPIDGTQDFVEETGEFAVHIGLSYRDEAVLGVVYEPATDTMYFGVKGQGAFKEKEGLTQRLKVSDKSNLREAKVALSRSSLTDKDMQDRLEDMDFAESQVIGSMGSKFAYIAEGRFDVYFSINPKSKEWDTCAPQVILEEAGGKVTDMNGDALRYNKKDVYNREGVIASNNVMHEEVMRYIA